MVVILSLIIVGCTIAVLPIVPVLLDKVLGDFPIYGGGVGAAQPPHIIPFHPAWVAQPPTLGRRTRFLEGRGPSKPPQL